VVKLQALAAAPCDAYCGQRGSFTYVRPTPIQLPLFTEAASLIRARAERNEFRFDRLEVARPVWPRPALPPVGRLDIQPSPYSPGPRRQDPGRSGAKVPRLHTGRLWHRDTHALSLLGFALPGPVAAEQVYRAKNPMGLSPIRSARKASSTAQARSDAALSAN
jgi:hypothetical protein